MTMTTILLLAIVYYQILGDFHQSIQYIYSKGPECTCLVCERGQ
jgi:hypothetical protein